MNNLLKCDYCKKEYKYLYRCRITCGGEFLFDFCERDYSVWGAEIEEILGDKPNRREKEKADQDWSDPFSDSGYSDTTGI
jgi:hypothetical protein